MKLSAHNEKNIVALVIVLAALFLFLVFHQNQTFIEESETLSTFILLASIGMGLMLVLFYMVSDRHAKTTRTKSHTAKKTSKKRKR